MNAVNRRQVLGATGLGLAALPLGAGAARAGAGHGADRAADHGGGTSRTVTPGADRLARSGWAALRGQRVGVVTNPTGILQDLTHVVDAMVASGRVDVVAVFGPEHGFRGTAQAGDSEGSHRDPRTGVMVYDAYGATAEKLAALYREARVETVVFDIQDVGARFYTYIWTMYAAMQAAVATGARFVVLDRPNPVGGSARGPLLRPGFTSGVGQEEIVQQHGLTVGELARFFDAELLPADAGGRLADLTVVPVTGWSRQQTFADTGLTWVMPSPNMPTPDTALLYPGTCLFEATNLSEGRGTTRPFELIGAPYIDHRWAQALQDKDIPGVRVPGGVLHADVQQAGRQGLRRRPGAHHRPRQGRGDHRRHAHDGRGQAALSRVRLAGRRGPLDRPADRLHPLPRHAGRRCTRRGDRRRLADGAGRVEPATR